MNKTAIKQEIGNVKDEIEQVHAAVFECLFLLTLQQKKSNSDDMPRFNDRMDRQENRIKAVISHLGQSLASALEGIPQPIPGELVKLQGDSRKGLDDFLQRLSQLRKSVRNGEAKDTDFVEMDKLLSSQVLPKALAFSTGLTDFVQKTLNASLDAETNQINTAIDQIGKIGTMINLIAVNASIEAARAGESGRGFGVIASEIQVLSQRSKQAVEQLSARLD